MRRYGKEILYLYRILFGVLPLLFLSACSQKEAVPLKDPEVVIGEFVPKEVVDDAQVVLLDYCAVVIPADYVETDIPGLYESVNAPFESSNIYYSISDGFKEGSIQKKLTKEDFARILTEKIKKEGQECSLEITDFQSDCFDGIPSYRIRSVYSYEDKTILQLMYIIAGERTCTVTYSQLSDDELMVDFEVEEGKIKVVKKS